MYIIILVCTEISLGKQYCSAHPIAPYRILKCTSVCLHIDATSANALIDASRATQSVYTRCEFVMAITCPSHLEYRIAVALVLLIHYINRLSPEAAPLHLWRIAAGVLLADLQIQRSKCDNVTFIDMQTQRHCSTFLTFL